MDIEIVVPRGGDCPYRERAWEWVRGQYETEHPDWALTEAPAPEGEWCKAAAVNPVVEASNGKIVVQADADLWCDGLMEAVEVVERGASWSVPHLKVHRLSQGGTEAVLTGEHWRPQTLTQRPYQGFLGGGIVVARKEVFLQARLDPRFRNWGSEDEAHAFALGCLFGKPWRGTADLIHLFHPPQERDNRRWGSRESWHLRRRYFEARRNPEAMRALLEEARCPSPA